MLCEIPVQPIHGKCTGNIVSVIDTLDFYCTSNRTCDCQWSAGSSVALVMAYNTPIYCRCVSGVCLCTVCR